MLMTGEARGNAARAESKHAAGISPRKRICGHSMREARKHKPAIKPARLTEQRGPMKFVRGMRPSLGRASMTMTAHDMAGGDCQGRHIVSWHDFDAGIKPQPLGRACSLEAKGEMTVATLNCTKAA